MGPEPAGRRGAWQPRSRRHLKRGGIGSACLLGASAPLNSAPMKRAPRVGRPWAGCRAWARAALVEASDSLIDPIDGGVSTANRSTAARPSPVWVWSPQTHSLRNRSERSQATQIGSSPTGSSGVADVWPLLAHHHDRSVAAKAQGSAAGGFPRAVPAPAAGAAWRTASDPAAAAGPTGGGLRAVGPRAELAEGRQRQEPADQCPQRDGESEAVLSWSLAPSPLPAAGRWLL